MGHCRTFRDRLVEMVGWCDGLSCAPRSAVTTVVLWLICLYALGTNTALTSHQNCWNSQMSTDKIWNDETRHQLRERLRSAILGELRLSKRGREEIFEDCNELYIQEECPENECDMFIEFASDELNRAEANLESEKTAWPEETDCDRLDRVEMALRERGILLWQASPCCDTCSRAEIPDRIDVIDNRYPGFRYRFRGYTFFHDQNMSDMLADSTELSVYLAYGWVSQDDSETPPEDYESQALGIANEICECLRDQRFEPNWNGSLDKKIGISLNWQRRTLLE